MIHVRRSKRSHLLSFQVLPFSLVGCAGIRQYQRYVCMYVTFLMRSRCAMIELKVCSASNIRVDVALIRT